MIAVSTLWSVAGTYYNFTFSFMLIVLCSESHSESNRALDDDMIKDHWSQFKTSLNGHSSATIVGTNWDSFKSRTQEKNGLFANKDKLPSIIEHRMQTKTALANANKQLLRNVNHEVRSPLNAALSGLQILAEDPRFKSTGPAGLDMLKSITSSVVSATDALNDAILEEGVRRRSLSLERSRESLHKVLCEQVGLAKGEAKVRALSLAYETPVGDAIVLVDKAKMRQVLRNLILCTMRSAQDGGTVTVQLGIVGDLVRVEIQAQVSLILCVECCSACLTLKM